MITCIAERLCFTLIKRPFRIKSLAKAIFILNQVNPPEAEKPSIGGQGFKMHIPNEINKDNNLNKDKITSKKPDNDFTSGLHQMFLVKF